MKTTFRHLLSVVLALAAIACAVPSAYAVNCVPSDFNNDGMSDLFWLHTDTNTFEWQMNGAALLGGTGPVQTVGDPNFQVKGIGDFDNDGKADVLWVHTDGRVYVWLMNGTIPSAAYIGTIVGPWSVQGVGDFDGDGKADILWRNSASGDMFVWLMNGAGAYTGVYIVPTGLALSATVEGIGDFDGNGKADVLFKDGVNTSVWLNNGNLASFALASVAPLPDLTWQVKGIGDFNHDGRSDILVMEPGGTVYVWFMNGAAATFNYVATVVGPWTVQAVGDYNADGYADVFWRNGTTTLMWLNNGGTGTSFTYAPVAVVNDLNWNVTASKTTAPCLSPIAPSLVASRVSGVAPLAVFFDASGTVVTNPASKPFHDVEYRWNFGDPASGATWSQGAQPGVNSKNLATGPVTGHVFETSGGPYTVTLTVVDANGATATTTTSITVTDPNTAFSTTNTKCFSKTGNFTGCPSGASQITDAAGDFDGAVNGNMASNRRLLFRAGEAWTASAPAKIISNGPGIIGSYGDGGPGTGTPPVVTGNIGDAIIQLSSSTTPTIGDWRIMDLELTASNHGSSVGVGTGQSGGGIKQVTLLRVNVHNASHNIEFNPSILDFWNANGHAGHSMYDQMAVVDSTSGVVAGTAGGYGMYTGAKRYMILGNNLNNNGGGEHVLRTPQIINAVISNNTLANQGAGGKHILKMHGYSADVSGAWNAPSDYNSSIVSTENPNYPTSGTYSEKIVISDNKFNATAPSGDASWTVAIGPQDNAHDERVRDVIFERNWMVTSASAGQQVALITWSSRTTIRNNLINMTNAAFHNAILSEKRGIDGTGAPSEQYPNFVWVYNNTIYSGSSGDFIGLELASGAGHDNSAANVVMKNNIGYAPSSSSPVMKDGNGASPVAVLLNNTSTPKTQNPTFTTTPPVAVTDYKPTCTGNTYPCQQGTPVPVMSDFFRVNEPATRDIGAVIH